MEECLVSYAVTETLHASVYMVLAAVLLVLSVALLWPERKEVAYHADDDDDNQSFSYFSIDYSYNFARPHHYFRRWSNSYTTNETTVW